MWSEPFGSSKESEGSQKPKESEPFRKSEEKQFSSEAWEDSTKSTTSEFLHHIFHKPQACISFPEINVPSLTSLLILC
jgi:hypothetical protein